MCRPLVVWLFGLLGRPFLRSGGLHTPPFAVYHCCPPPLLRLLLLLLRLRLLPPPPTSPHTGQMELYDLSEDPSERHNLCDYVAHTCGPGITRGGAAKAGAATATTSRRTATSSTSTDDRDAGVDEGEERGDAVWAALTWMMALRQALLGRGLRAVGLLPSKGTSRRGRRSGNGGGRRRGPAAARRAAAPAPPPT